jgi:hypothetical protein
VPFYTKYKEDKVKSTGTVGKVPKTINGETVASQWLRAEMQR